MDKTEGSFRQRRFETQAARAIFEQAVFDLGCPVCSTTNGYLVVVVEEVTELAGKEAAEDLEIIHIHLVFRRSIVIPISYASFPLPRVRPT